MSQFEDNPFGEPNIDNPFADPAVQQVARNTTTNQRGLEDYNPFENESQTTTTLSPLPQPAIVQPSIQSVPSGQQYQISDGNNAGITQISTAELQELRRRQDELERKAQELERREAELRNNTAGVRRNNWPPVPDKCCFQPCFYHDISVDIPSDFQSIVKKLYQLWMFYALIMFVNIFGGILIIVNGGDWRTFGLAIFYCMIFTPASFLCWYRPAYKAFRNDSSFNFMVFFFVFFFQTIVTVIQTIGIPGSGTCGFIIAISQFDKTVVGTLIAIIVLLIAISYGSCAAGNIMMLSKIHAIYRSSGASMSKARQEFQTEFFRNPHVQQAAADATRVAVDSQMNSNRNRY